MFAHVGGKPISTLVLALLCATIGIAQAGDDPAQPSALLIADQPGSVATIDCEGCDQPFDVRVVSLADIRDTAAQSDPNKPVRIATDIRHPETGRTIHVNIVEVFFHQLQSGAALSFSGQSRFELIRNSEEPYCRLCDLDALFEDQVLNTDGPSDGDSVCSICKEPIVELLVQVTVDGDRTRTPNYGIQFVFKQGQGPLSLDEFRGPDGVVPGGRHSEGDDEGGNPGGSPGGEDEMGGNPGG